MHLRFTSYPPSFRFRGHDDVFTIHALRCSIYRWSDRSAHFKRLRRSGLSNLFLPQGAGDDDAAMLTEVSSPYCTVVTYS